MKLSSFQETSTANILFKPIGTGFGDELLRLVIFGDQITSSIVADSVEDKLLSFDLSVSYLVLVLIKILMILFISKLHVQLMLAQ